jgi:hypothetical protein
MVDLTGFGTGYPFSYRINGVVCRFVRHRFMVHIVFSGVVVGMTKKGVLWRLPEEEVIR